MIQNKRKTKRKIRLKCNKINENLYIKQLIGFILQDNKKLHFLNNELQSKMKLINETICEIKIQNLNNWQFFGLLLKENKLSSLQNEILEKRIDILYRKIRQTQNLSIYGKNTFIEMLVETEKSCPICFEVFEVGKTVICKCWHSVCTDCHSKISECPMCRLEFF